MPTRLVDPNSRTRNLTRFTVFAKIVTLYDNHQRLAFAKQRCAWLDADV
jgi:hypothetical protein